jgi:hypothetical protein
MSVIEVQSPHHLGDSIINFIFFYKIKELIEENNIMIHYYCWKQYHKNLLDFKCSENIQIFEYEDKGYLLWQGNSPHQHHIEDKLCGMFNIFLQHHNIHTSVNSFEYQDPELLTRFEKLDNKYKNIDVLVINSNPLSAQYHYNKNVWDDFIIKLSNNRIVATTQEVNESILSVNNISVKNIAAMALNVKIIIAINTGPSIPLYNTDILNNVEVIYLFGSNGSNFKTRKIHEMSNIDDLSFLL